MATDFLEDPSWYKDAVIYELHVRSFYDSDDDGFGDFDGMRKKLPYLESLGVNTLWLLPFLESPLRDDGYDISDYLKILPVHGSMDAFQEFLDEAHERGMRVITELVLNHTSDQHPWFQEARDPESDKHDWYVWSETTDKYSEARIIFTDTEDSNWSWDAKAQKYYWHRFFSHQPDLNYENPEVREAMKEVMYFWLDMGVDGLRLDAVPYLYEREGTSCENLPETIEYIKELRAAIEERYGPGRVLLAEANQWPEDTLPYFADGEGVQMAFNFPIMPRMFMALRRANRRPLIEMLEVTNDIPDEVQWAIFLRNHDELTLEMVTDEERDYMYNEYGADPRFRINVGIRRRLTPLLGGERRRIEMMNALLLSLKGSPIIYYGDEIGMGDDPFLGDRNGVRTPMQWSADKNAGFSRAPHHRLFMPPINRGPYSYEFVNVEDAEQDPHSLLNFMKRLLALRKRFVKVFGRGSIEVLPVDNQSILAFLREHEGEQILCLFNLSRFAQSTMLPVREEYKGHVPVEMFSQTAFPTFEDDPYHMLLGPHGFYWFNLEPEEEFDTAPASQREHATDGADGRLPVLRVQEGLQNVLVRTLVAGKGLERFEALLPDFLEKQRWFGRKGETIRNVTLDDAVRLQAKPFPVYLALLNVEVAGSSDHYVLPLTTTGEDKADTLMEEHPDACLAWIEGPHREDRGLLHDAAINPAFWKALFEWWQSRGKGRSLKGIYLPTLNRSIRGHRVEEVELFSGEQSNSAAIIDDQYFIKLYRRLERGPNPETELLDYLTDTGFPFVPTLHGTLTFRRPDQTYAMGILQEALDVEADGWTHTLNMMDRFLNRVADTPPPEDASTPDGYTDEAPAWLENVAPEMLSLAQVLGIRTAELHLAFSKAEAPDIAPQPGTDESSEALANRIRDDLRSTRARLAEREDEGELNDEIQTPFPSDWERAEQQIDRLEHLEPLEVRIRLHGDYHLGQVLRAEGEYYVLDFEGEPTRPLAERRQRDFALRDVAGMLRSLEYAALSAWRKHQEEAEEEAPALKTWTNHLVQWCEALFLNGYYDTAGDAAFAQPEEARRSYLWAYLLEKALYEVRYELSHRPSWVWLPLRGLLRLFEETRPDTTEIPEASAPPEGEAGHPSRDQLPDEA